MRFIFKSRYHRQNLPVKFLHFHEYPISGLQTIKYHRLSSPEIHFTKPQCSQSPSHIPIKLATPKIHPPRLHNHPHHYPAFIPLLAPPNNRHVCGKKERKKRYKHSRPSSQYLSGKQTRDKNLRRMTR